MARFGAFPAQLPEGSVQTIITYLRGKLNDKWDAVEAAYDLLGFSLHAARGVAGRSQMAGVPSDKDACFEFESLIRDHSRMKSQTQQPVQTQEGEEKGKEEEGQSPIAPAPKMVGQLIVPPWLTAFLLQLMQKLLTT